MGVLLGLLAAIGYGTSDFVGGIAGRRGSSGAASLVVQSSGLVVTLLVVAALRPAAPSAGSLAWGAVAGLGGGVGSVSLYRGLTVGRMSVVAPLSGLLAAALPVLVGATLGQHLAALSWVGIVIAFPAILFVSLSRDHDRGARRASVVFGLLAGLAFGFFFVALDRAGTHAGPWPLVPCQLVTLTTVTLTVGIARPLRPRRSDVRRALLPGLFAGLVGGTASICYLVATGHGQLAVVAVLSSLYPAVTVILARFGLGERWAPSQAVGLLVAALAVVLISTG